MKILMILSNVLLNCAAQLLMRKGMLIIGALFLPKAVIPQTTKQVWELHEAVEVKACPSDVIAAIRTLHNMTILKSRDGEGVVREFANNYILQNYD